MELLHRMSTLVNKLAKTKKELAPIPHHRWKVKLLHKRRTCPRKKVFSMVYYATSDKSFFGWVRNVSGSGVFIGTGEPLFPRTDVTLVFTMSGNGVPIKTNGKVMWTGKNGMGLKFEAVDELTRGKIKSALSQM